MDSFPRSNSENVGMSGRKISIALLSARSSHQGVSNPGDESCGQTCHHGTCTDSHSGHLSNAIHVCARGSDILRKLLG
jgi:hypothetical protein